MLKGAHFVAFSSRKPLRVEYKVDGCARFDEINHHNWLNKQPTHGPAAGDLFYWGLGILFFFVIY